jgi:purine-binding chemotaxis protein CheW
MEGFPVDEVLKGAKQQEEVKKYFIFSVNGIDFSTEIDRVTEIITKPMISPVPNANNYCRGIINLRGTIIPVIDMRVKMHFPSKEYDERTCVIVMTIQDQLIGVVVDEVREVTDIPLEKLFDSPANNMRAGDGRNYTSKIANLDGGRVIQILDIEKVFDVKGQE